MWKNTLFRNDDGEFECRITLPMLSRSAVTAEVESSPPDTISDKLSLQLVEVIWTKLENGEIAPTLDVVFESLRESHPALSRFTRLEGSDLTLEDIFDHLVAGAQNLSSSEERHSAIGEESSVDLDKIHLVPCVFDGRYESEQMIPEPQQAAADFIESNCDKLEKLLLQELSADLIDRYGEPAMQLILDENGNLLQHELIIRCDLLSVSISTRHFNGLAYSEYAFATAWDEEHLTKLVLHGDRLVFVGDHGAGWVDPNDADQPPIRNPFQ